MKSESEAFSGAWLTALARKAGDYSRPFIIGNIYFFFYLGVSIWLPFFNLYLLDKGFTGSQVGIVVGLYQATLFFVVPVWGMVADRFGTRVTLHIVLFGAMLLVWFLRLVPTFHILIFYMICLAFLQHPVGMLTDSMAITYVRHTHQVTFGQLRVWGSVSWALGTTIMGRFLLTHDTTTVFHIAPLVYGFTWLIIWFYQKPAGSQRVRVSFSLGELKEIFANKKILWFLMLLLLFGVGASPFYIFINLYFRDIGATQQQVGYGFAVMALSEVPMFFIAGRLVKRFGAPNVLLFAFAIAAIRLGLYGFIGDPVKAILLGLAQGFTFSLFWVVVVEIMHNVVPEKWRATAQSLIWACHVGAGVTIGNMSIGWLSDIFHMRTVMFFASGWTLFVFFGMVVYFWKFKVLRHEHVVPNPGTPNSGVLG